MPFGGGDPKVIGDGQTLTLRPEFGRGGADLWDMRDFMVAWIEYDAAWKAALAAAADFAAYKAAVGAIKSPVSMIDGLP